MNKCHLTISCISRVIADFVLNFVAMVTGLVVVEFVCHHSRAQPRIPLTTHKRHRDIFYTYGFLSQILLPWQPGSVVVKFDWHHSIARPRKPPVRRKSQTSQRYLLYKPSYSRFCLEFRFHGNALVAMPTRVGRGRICLTLFNSPTPKNPYYTQTSRRHLSQAAVVLYFVFCQLWFLILVSIESPCMTSY